MKWLFAVALLVSSFNVRADHAASESPLTDKNKARLLQALGAALNDEDITQQQYDRSIAWVNATPCDGVDRSLTTLGQTQLEAAIAKEQGRQTISVFESFKSNEWLILLTDLSEGDKPYLFYSKDPVGGGHPVTAWSGAATIFETSEVEKWVKKNAPGIPDRLASCFAWHITLNRE